VASTFASTSQISPGLVPDHAYTVLKVYQDRGTWKVQLYNPSGVDGTLPPLDGKDDGFVTITWAAFCKSFQYVNTAG
jgi:hypothetical protein